MCFKVRCILSYHFRSFASSSICCNSANGVVLYIINNTDRHFFYENQHSLYFAPLSPNVITSFTCVVIKIYKTQKTINDDKYGQGY